jgi:TorA maturation chaperone TorD
MTTTLPVFDLALNRSRAVLYRLLASALADPRTGSWPRLAEPSTRTLSTDAAALVRSERQAVASPLARGEQPLGTLEVEPLLVALPESAEALNGLYESAFGLLVSGSCPPYESEYVDGKLSFQRAQLLADVAGFYQAFGLEPSHDHPERHDHLVLELEFMATLLDLEHRAAETSSPEADERIALCQEAQRKFLTEHLAWWVPTFAALLRHQAPHGFYASAADLLGALIAAERGLLSVDAPHCVSQPSRVERPEECEGCALVND